MESCDFSNCNFELTRIKVSSRSLMKKITRSSMKRLLFSY